MPPPVFGFEIHQDSFENPDTRKILWVGWNAVRADRARNVLPGFGYVIDGFHVWILRGSRQR